MRTVRARRGQSPRRARPAPPQAQGAALDRAVLNRWGFVNLAFRREFAQQTVRGLFCGRVEPNVTTVKAV